MMNDPAAWVLPLGVLAFFVTFSLGIWSDTKQRKRFAKDREVFLGNLQEEGYTENELKSVATFLNRDHVMELMIPNIREELGKDDFLRLVEDLNKYCPLETWQKKYFAVGIFVVVLAAIFGTFIIFS